MSAGNSYNGWPANSDGNAIGIDTQFGKKVGAPPFGSGGYAGGMKSGDVSTLFIYLINRLHNEVEPMMNQGGNGYGCWGYSYRANVNNPSQLSCHASGTAIDYNAPKHPNGTSTGPNGGGGWSGSQYNKIRDILAGPLQGAIRWLTSNDPMHFEIYGNSSKVASVAKSLGGGGTPVPPTPTPEPPKPEPEDDMPRRILTVYDAKMNPLGQALDGPTGVITLANPDEANAVQAVIDNDNMVNGAQIDIYNAVLARSPVITSLIHKVWDDHFEATPGGGSGSTGDILSAIYRDVNG